MKKIITIETKTTKNMCEVRDDIHNQLRGNQDYIDSNIVLSDDASENKVYIYIADDVKEMPKIILNK